jgi:N-glycosylase/DNA lyase
LLESLNTLDYVSAKEQLIGIRGVGEKVASCILLFGYHHMEAFPLDTWMQKVMKKYYPTKDKTFFAPYAALAQQYLFHGERLGGRL